VLTAETAGVFSVLSDFDLLDLLTQRRSVASSVLADHSDLLRATTHSVRWGKVAMDTDAMGKRRGRAAGEKKNLTACAWTVYTDLRRVS